MIQRYGTGSDGKRIPVAVVYTKDEHSLRRKMIAPQALEVVRILKKSGYQAYIVGGAVRDLLLNKIPKDFDVATDAVPNRIRKIFPNAWIIGKRFKLAHVIFPGRYIVEVTTFRAVSSGNFNAVYGSIEEDVRRRDFTVNALFYDPEKEQLIDYVGGVRDLKNGKLVNVIPLETIFDSDPVRMLRAAKYAAKCGLKIPHKMKAVLRKKASLLATVSVSRLTEEFFKILSSGKATAVFEQIDELNLMPFFLPNLSSALSASKTVRKTFYAEMMLLDAEVSASGADSFPERDVLLFHFFKVFLPPFRQEAGWFENFSEKKAFCKEFEKPLQLPVSQIEGAVRMIFDLRDGVKPKERRFGSGKKRRFRSSKKKAGKDSNDDGKKNGGQSF